MQDEAVGSGQTCMLHELPSYLQRILTDVESADTDTVSGTQVQVLDLVAISRLTAWRDQHAHLLLRRHSLTGEIARSAVLYPPLILQRARVYEALYYADLAAADAYVVCTLCESVRGDEWVSDLEPRDLSGQPWPRSLSDSLRVQVDALALLCRCLVDLGALQDALGRRDELVQRLSELHNAESSHQKQPQPSLQSVIADVPFRLYPKETDTLAILDSTNGTSSKFGMSRREIYPWNEHEPDRNSSESVCELNKMLREAAPDLEAKVTALPALDGSGTWHQLGLFASKDLAPGSTVLCEKSILTAIRPLEDALCDACGADLESVPRDAMSQCPGEDCDLTFCSNDCANRAVTEYHKPNVMDETDQPTDTGGHNQSDSTHGDDDDDDDVEEEEDDYSSDYPPAHAPFCGNTALQEIGRTSSTSTPEWDLYFLLLTRTIQMSTTQSIHPLDLPSTKYLWGDFSSYLTTSQDHGDGSGSKPGSGSNVDATLPFSLYHNIALPLQFSETLLHSLPSHTPYSSHWLAHFDFWIVQTLFAKFRGVANAQQSTYDGKAEIAAVHPLWCLANHSCAPNVEWTPTGTREFKVRSDLVSVRPLHVSQSEGIVKGTEIWSHYTDVRLDVAQRRERLREVLGGICRCERCLVEAEEV